MKKILLTILILIFATSSVFAQNSNVSSTSDSKIENIVETTTNSNLMANKELETKTVAEVAEFYGINPNKYTKRLGKYYGLEFKTSNRIGSLEDVYGLEPSVATTLAESIANGTPLPSPEVSPETEEKVDYHLSPIVLILVGAYILSRILSKKKIKLLSIVNHKKIWNILLMISFLVSGVLGVMLVIKNNLGNTGSARFDGLFWHVELGIAMVIISIFHIAERWYYYNRMFSRKKKTARKRKLVVKTSSNTA